jgi:hypothetical protein
MVQHGTERCFQWFQPRLESLPGFGAVPVDRLTDLFRRRGADSTLGFVEAQACLFEVQPAGAEQGADLGLRVLDHMLIDDAVDAARQDVVDMGHQPDVVAIIAPQIRQIVSEGLALGEMLLEVGEAARQRVAAGVDDLGIGQDQVNEGGVQPVVGQLVDKERPIGLALDAGAVKVLLAQLPQIVRRQTASRRG